MISIKQAQQKNQLDQFIKERSDLPAGNLDKVERCLQSMLGTPIEAQEASRQESSGDCSDS